MKLAYCTTVATVLVLVAMSFATGIYVMFTYRPTLDWAYDDILALRDSTLLDINRELHGWLAVALPIALIAHAVVSVILTFDRARITKSRAIGLVSLIAAFTLLGAAWFGAREMQDDKLELSIASLDTSPTDRLYANDDSLNRAYALHCVFIPAAFVPLLMIAIWTLRPKHSSRGSSSGGIVPPAPK